jgi:hypothetical protein
MTNSRFDIDKPFTLGMAIALLIIHNGIAFIKLFLNEYCPKCINKKARIKLRINIGNKASKSDLPITGNFCLFNSNSREPSSTISISPIVPKMGKIDVRFGISR